ncbi:hypothetical protein GOY14_00905 [Wolbachia endosymbiont of Dipetalonema caudispina]|uniref:hypothetical protein n=1 Tax=Wolbachia endosymbiont of Dipetalonema caudispina TaxID=1812112 RepID=UPI00158B5ACD|nr:hypothetical protein [Wolbachia endosymbiont of Dipetalonema caudispina]QKX00913.1 hypothetical protein GOY14_00905 [Wolbachia endosymbiont of Dipetalonema caudispina]
MNTFRISSSLKYSIATFLLCTSVLTTGVSIYPISLAMCGTTTTTAPSSFYITIASISIIAALSLIIYLSKLTLPIINNKKQEVTYNIFEKRSDSNDISTQIPETTAMLTSSSTPNFKKPTTINASISSSNASISSSLPSTATSLTQPSQLALLTPPLSPSFITNQNTNVILTSPPSSLLSQSLNIPPPPPLPPNEKFLSSTIIKNPSITRLKSHNKNFQEELKEKLQKIKEKIAKVSRHEIL